MPKWILTKAILGCVLLISCSKNSLEVQNLAAEVVYFDFRGVSYPLAADSSLVLDEIPNGTYQYSTTVGLPSGVTKWNPGKGLTGELAFKYSKTKTLVQYGSVTDSGTYYIEATVSSSNRIDETSPTAP